MKVVLVANTTWNIYNFRLNVIDKLIEEGFKVEVIAPIDEYIEYKEKYPSVVHHHLRTMDRNSTNPFINLLLVVELVRKYKRINPDLIIHYTNKLNIFGGLAARIAKIKSIAIVTGLGYAFIHSGWIKNVTKLLYKYTSKFHQKFIFENIDDRKLFYKLGIIQENQAISIKGCGVNTSYYYPQNNGILKPTKNIIFIFIGRLLYDKGIREYVDAAKIIKQEFPTIKFWIVGELDTKNPAAIDTEDLNDWTASKIVYYHGFNRDVRPLLGKADCVVLPSYREAIPRTLTEAMAMGKAIITTDVAGCREAVEDGVNGFLADAKDVSSLVRAMRTYIMLSPTDRSNMGNIGRAKALKEFDDKNIASDIFAQVDSILS